MQTVILCGGTGVRAMPSSARDPWWAYDAGDGRFVNDWFGELRKAMR